MRKTLLRAAALCAVVLLVVVASAAALRLTFEHVVVDADGGFTPTTLPRDHLAPIKLQGHGRISTDDGSDPPALRQIVLWFDRHGAVETRGLAVCTRAELAATDTRQARRACRDAIVGKGFGKAVVRFPESKPLPVSSPITIFNGPRKHGNPTVLAHAYLSVPAPTTYIVPIEIQMVHDGRYGFKTVAQIPKIANGFGIPTYGELKIGREWVLRGKRLSYANASCSDGRLQAKGQFRFDDGTFLEGSFLKKCRGEG